MLCTKNDQKGDEGKIGNAVKAGPRNKEKGESYRLKQVEGWLEWLEKPGHFEVETYETQQKTENFDGEDRSKDAQYMMEGYM